MSTIVWQLQEAKSRFSELVEQAIKHGAQTVTKHASRGQAQAGDLAVGPGMIVFLSGRLANSNSTSAWV